MCRPTRWPTRWPTRRWDRILNFYRFSIDEFLTPQQIKSYFSRKAAKTKQVVADEDEATELAQKDH